MSTPLRTKPRQMVPPRSFECWLDHRKRVFGTRSRQMVLTRSFECCPDHCKRASGGCDTRSRNFTLKDGARVATRSLIDRQASGHEGNKARGEGREGVVRGKGGSEPRQRLDRCSVYL